MTGTEETREEIREGTEGQPMKKKNTKSKKKYLVAALAVCLLLVAAGFLYPCKAPMHIPYSLLTGFSYTVYNDHVELERYHWNLETVWIPDYMWSRPVTVIGEDCLVDKDMKKVFLPRYLQVIGENAFRNCWELDEVTGGEAVKVIEDYAFWACDDLYMFEPGKNLEEIGTAAFMMCHDLEIFPFAEKLQCIGYMAFAYSGLTEFPEEWQTENIYIDQEAFLETPWMRMQTEDFVICSGILLEYNGNDEIVRVPEGVRGIALSLDCWIREERKTKVTIKEMYLPRSIEYITAGAFDGKKNLRLYIPAGVEGLGITWDGNKTYLIGEKNMTIITTAGSAAEAYAREMGLACEIVEGW